MDILCALTAQFSVPNIVPMTFDFNDKLIFLYILQELVLLPSICVSTRIIYIFILLDNARIFPKLVEVKN